MKESKLQEIELRDTQLQPFRHLLRYVYTGQMSLSTQKDEMILEILGLAHQYGFTDLETSISDYLRLTLLNISNVSLIYDTASLYQLETLVNACCSYMDKYASEVIKHESLTCKYQAAFHLMNFGKTIIIYKIDFNYTLNFIFIIALTASSFEAVISRDSFCALEVDIFLAAWSWVRANPEATAAERDCILGAVRLPLMSTQVYIDFVCK